VGVGVGVGVGRAGGRRWGRQSGDESGEGGARRRLAGCLLLLLLHVEFHQVWSNGRVGWAAF